MCAEPPPRGRVVGDQKDAYPVEEGHRQTELWSLSVRVDVSGKKAFSGDIAKDHSHGSAKTHRHG